VSETRKASADELLRLAQTRADIFLKQGVTTLEVKSGYGLDRDTEIRCLEVARKLKGPRIVSTYLGAHSKSPDFTDLDVYIKYIVTTFCLKLQQKSSPNELIFISRRDFTLPLKRAPTFLARVNWDCESWPTSSS